MALGGTNFKLRSSTHLDHYEPMEFTATAVYTAGDMIKHYDVVGVIVGTVAIGHQAVLVFEASRIIVPCVEVTSGNLASLYEGKKVYFDATNAEVTPTALGNTLCGIVLVTPTVGDEEIEICLMGALGIVS